MLQPIKTFLNYFQKNANNSTNFRPTNDLNMTDEANSPAVVDGGTFDDDPLTDPLAIDDDFTEVSAESAEEIVTEVVKDCVSDFIFVDIEKLKGIKSNEKSTKSNDKKLSDINGNSRSSVKCEDKKKLVAHDIHLNADNGKSVDENEEDEENCDVEKLIDTLNAKQSKKVPIIIPHQAEVTKTKDEKCVFVINASSEADDDVNDSSALLEEARSDGSDSGYAGSDTLQNISAIEKSLASSTPGKSSLKRKSIDQTLHDQPKKSKQGINFGNVVVYYFPRCQGFSCVPTQGGSTLGMSSKHAYKKSFTLLEHANEQRRLHRLKIAGNELNPSSSSSDESKSEDEISENSLSEADSDAYGFLQPVTARQRRAMLKAAGVRKIDTTEKDECRQLRVSREVCGCTCRSYCDPDTCECSLAGIKCQVDRLKPHEFPCGCNRDGCANVNGRIEFNPSRVKTHFIHTIMRLELEKRQELSSDDVGNGVIQHTSSKWWSQMHPSSHSSIPNASNGNSYNSYIYNNGASSQSTSANYTAIKIPSISTMVAPGIPSQESLDLHYAYRDRDECSSSLTLTSETGVGGTSFNNSNDYYTTYNFMPHTSSSSVGSPSAFHSNYSLNQSLVPPYHQQSTFSNECQYSNYTLSNGNGTINYRIENELNHSYSSMHSGVLSSRINYQPVIASLPQQAHDSNNPTSNSNPNFMPASNQNERGDSSENLGEIIKKTISESVTA